MLNRVILMGRLTADPELKKTNSDLSVTSFSLAVDRNYGKGADRQTDFINCVAWRQTAEFISRYFSKGRLMAVEGSLQVRNYVDRNENKRQAVEVVVDQVYFADSKNATSASAPTAPDDFGPPLLCGRTRFRQLFRPSFHRVQLWLFQRRCGGL